MDTGAPAAEAAPATGELTLHEAGLLLDAGYEQNPDLHDTERGAPEATAEPKLEGDDPDNSAPATDPAEKPEGNDPEENLPPIERPRSWSKDADDDWNAIPRARQEKIAANEQARESDIRQRINEAAEKSKAAEARLSEVEKVRQQYESKLTSTVKVMEDALQAEFGDIQTMQDVRKLQAEDPFRFQAWQVRQMELTAAKSETLAVEQRQAQEKQSKRASYEAEQNKLLIELVPEMADSKKAAELRERAVKMLNDDLGLKTDLLSRWMTDDTGHEILSNAGIQKLIADGLKYRDIQNAPKAVAAKPVPPVQRPGVARASGDAASDQIKALEDRLTRTGSEKDAWALYEAKLNASSRRAS
jgi:hypothetical protein